MSKVSRDFKSLPRTYVELVGILPPRPIHTDGDYEEVADMIDVMAGHKLNKAQEDYLEILSQMVEAYDRDHVELPDVSPLDMLKHLMESNDMNADQLGKLLGDASLGSKILSGKREWSKAHIRALCEHFKVGAGVFFLRL